MSHLSDIIRADIRAMSAYQVAALPEGFTKLDAMESPYHPFAHSPQLQAEWAARLAEAPIHLYPNPATSGLQAALRQAFDIPAAAEIALGNGSDELIQLITMLVAKPGAAVLALEPSFVMYRHNAQVYGLDYIGVPLNDDFSMNLPAVLEAIALAENVLGNVYNVTDAFTTTNNFVEGAGNKYPKGTNVVVVKVGDAYKYDVLAGFVDLSGYVEKEAGKGLSDENFTAALKDKLDGIAAGANKYVHPTHTAAASGLYKTTVDEEGHVTATTPVTKDDITGLGIPAQDTTYDEATTAKAGLMSAADKTKLDGMDTTIDKAIANHTATDAEVSEMLAEVYGE